MDAFLGYEPAASRRRMQQDGLEAGDFGYRPEDAGLIRIGPLRITVMPKAPREGHEFGQSAGRNRTPGVLSGRWQLGEERSARVLHPNTGAGRVRGKSESPGAVRNRVGPIGHAVVPDAPGDLNPDRVLGGGRPG